MLNEFLIGLAVLLIILLFTIIYYYKGKIKRAYSLGRDELFKELLANGFTSRVNSYKSCNKYITPQSVVFVGDSITQDYNVSEYYSKFKAYNRGIGGDTTYGLLTRLDESVYQLNPKVIVLLIGTNDIVNFKTPIEIFNNVKKIINLIQEKLPNTKIILQSIYPVSEANHPKIDKNSVNIRKNKLIDEINEMLKTIPFVAYVDVFSILKDEENNLRLEYTVEGLHITPLGYEVITAYLEEIILEFLK